MKSISLVKGKERSVLRKHPWIFSGAVKPSEESVEDGELVKVVDFKGNFLGTGFYQSGKSILIRLISFEEEPIDQKFFDKKIFEAKRYRDEILLLNAKGTDAYRLFHGEGDGISGLIIDIYKNSAVIQSHNYGVYNSRFLIAKALKNIFLDAITVIYSKAKETLTTNVRTDIIDEFIEGNEAKNVVKENDILFEVNWVEGQKTGFFLDQRENRKILQNYCKNKTVLNCFCYTGGFSLYALKGNAESVTSIDISQKALDVLNRNLIINNLEANHTTICENVMEYLKNAGNQFDVVIVDPPAFAKSINKKHNAIQAYKRLNALALKQVKSGGIMLTFSCSQVIGEQLFYDTIVAAAIESNRNIRVIQKLTQGQDHPVNIFHPEGSYLKGLVLYVD